MVDQSDLDRAMTLAEMAPDSSVTFGVLAGRDERFAGTRSHEPPVSYLEDTEAPAYVLTNENRGIGVGTKRNTTTPASDRATVVMVTGRRTLCLVGGESDDEVIEIPHDTLAEVTFHTGWLAHRLALKTPRKQYHCWVSRDADEELLERVTAYVRERMPEAPYESEPEEKEPEFMYRGQPVTRDQHPGLPDEPPANGDSAPREDDESAHDGDGTADPADSSGSSADGNGHQPTDGESDHADRHAPGGRPTT